MTPSSFRVFRLFGIDVRVHQTFIVFVTLAVAWVLVLGDAGGAGIAPELLAVLIVFLLLHEFGHALAAKAVGVEVEDILLLPLMGMARLRGLPEKARPEILIAVAGPLANLLAAGATIGLAAILGDVNVAFAGPAESTVALIFWINAAMGVFNLIPAFPMDGGRVVRALLSTRLDYPAATRAASTIGIVVLIALGVTAWIVHPDPMLGFVVVVLIIFGRREVKTTERRAQAKRIAAMKEHLADEVADSPPGAIDLRLKNDPEMREEFERYREELERLD
jgi:stage IV sporulation protein FB